MTPFTQLLEAANRGDRKAASELWQRNEGVLDTRATKSKQIYIYSLFIFRGESRSDKSSCTRIN